MASRTTKRMFIMLGLVVLLIAALALGKFLQVRKLIANIPKPQPQVVTTTHAKLLEWQPQFHAVGSLVAVRGVDLASEVAGLVRHVGFRSGQDVHAGQVLVRLNADAEIALQRQLQVAVDLAIKVLARDRAQFTAKAVSQAQIDADEASLRSKQASLDQQKALVEKRTIRAPFSGRIGISTIVAGQYLNAGQSFVTLQALDPIYVDFTLPQQDAGKVQIGQHVALSDDGVAGGDATGKVSAISPKVDPATRNVQLQATVANPQRRLLPGMFARVAVDEGARKGYLTLPQTAITYNPYGSTVYIVQPGATLTVKQVFVTTGPTRGDQVAVLSGIHAGDEVVTSGQLKLKNGTAIVVNNAVQPTDAAHPTPQEQ